MAVRRSRLAIRHFPRSKQSKVLCTRRDVNKFLDGSDGYKCPCESKTDTSGIHMTGCCDKIGLAMGNAAACEFILEMRKERFDKPALADTWHYFQCLLQMREVDPLTNTITIRFKVGGVACCAATHFMAYGYSGRSRKCQMLVALVRRGKIVL